MKANLIALPDIVEYAMRKSAWTGIRYVMELSPFTDDSPSV